MKDSSKLGQQFLELLENNKKLVFKIANVYGKNDEEIKDLVQEITLQLWKSFPDYNPDFAVSTWMYRIALNVSISFYRKEKSRKKLHQNFEKEAHIFYWEEQTFDEKFKQLYHFIGQLKAFEKALIVLYLEGKKNSEIADIMGISATNVSTILNRIKTKLSNNFKTNKH